MIKKIPGYNGRYFATDDGKIISTISGSKKELSPCVNKKGYIETVLVNKNGKRKNEKWHRLIAKTFLKKVPGKNIINHKNGIKTDNRVENLEWCSLSENIKHAIEVLNKHFGPPKGILPPQFENRLRLSKNDVVIIKNRLKNGDMGFYIAKDYKVSDQTIYDIKNGRCWKEAK